MRIITVFPKLQKVVLKSGDVIKVSDGVTVIVGPNNVGKSLLLREIQAWLAGPVFARTPLRSTMLQNIVLGAWPDADEFMTWLELKYPRMQPGRYLYGQTISEHFLLQNNEQITVEEVRAICKTQQSGMANLAHAYALYLGLADRLTVAGSATTQNILTEYPQHPIHYLYRFRDLEAQVNDSMKRVFGMRLTVNRYGGQETTLHVGEVLATETVPPSEAYIQEIMSLPQIQDQGDGVRAFIGIFLSIITALRPLVIIDEPEAFLHPPQAYLLGRILAEQYGHDSQVLIATHSHDLVRGLTSAKASSESVTVARITRHESTRNRVHQVSADKIRDLYQDPLIRYYSMLDGLFFHGVILCESDSDCTYYRAVFESNDHVGDDQPEAPTDLHFTHCGGKARLPKAVRALREAGVPFACAVDFDFLQDNP
jgi:AAA domain, putative AbiEii toxin, Type IV TA system